MRVLHVISGIRPGAGGTTFALAGLTAAQANAGLDVATFSTFLAGDEHKGRELFDARVEMIRLGPATNPRSRHPDLAARMLEAVAKADVVHIHALWESAQSNAARAARAQGKPYLFTPHGMLEPWSMGQTLAKALKKRLYLRLRLRRLLQDAAAMHYTTPLERKNAERLGLRPTPIVEPNGLDLSEFRDLPPTGFLRARHPEPADGPIILFLSRIHPKKGLDVTIRAIAALQRRAVAGSLASRAKLVLAGPDSNGHLGELQRLATSLGVADRLVPVGMLDAKERLAAFADADVFILSSYNENYGIAVIEAMAAGVPVVVSDQVQCYPEVQACAGGSVLPVDPEAFATSLIAWLDDPTAAREAGRRGRQHALKQLGWGAIAERWVEHYGRLAAR